MVRVNPLKPTEKICGRRGGKAIRYNCDGEQCSEFVRVTTDDGRCVWSGCSGVLSALTAAVGVSGGSLVLSELLAFNK